MGKDYCNTNGILYNLQKQIDINNLLIFIENLDIIAIVNNINSDERIIDEIIERNPLKQLLTIDEVTATVQDLSKCAQLINCINLIIITGSHVI